MKRGYLITFEGVDFSGKSLQAKKLVYQLERLGRRVEIFREPGGTAISEKIRRLLLDPSHGEMYPLTELLLYSASRAQLVQEKILPFLAQGKTVICDRFLDSSTAYQGYGRNIPLELVQQAHSLAIGNLRPDITFLLDIDPVFAFQRKSANRQLDRLESEKIEFYTRVRQGYLKIAEKEKKRFVVLDASHPPEEIQKKIWSEIKKILAI